VIYLITHNSHDIFYRNPFGAVPSGKKLMLRLKADSSLPIQTVVLRTWKHTGEEEKFEMIETIHDSNIRIFEVCIDVPEVPGLFWYYFIIHELTKTYYYGNNNEHWGGIGQLYEYPPYSYQVTVYKKDFETPAWFKDCVMYQILVDRFYNGSDDGSILNEKKNSIIHENWYDLPCYMPDSKTGKYLNNDFFGGNLSGIIKKLPYLKELGIDVIYLNPIFEASSNHKYNTGDYMKVDEMFGDNKAFTDLCETAGKLGISIILDGVFSHTGSDSVYFNKEGNYDSLGAYQSEKSSFYSWYTFSNFPDSYECWWGVESLPNVNELEPSYQDFILSGKDSVVKHWIRLGCRGWRLDVADELPDEFLKNLRNAVKHTNPEAVIIGEVWEDASNKISYGKTREYLLGEELDSVMNYPLRQAILKFFTGDWDGIKFNSAIMSLYENYPVSSFYSLMNILGSHDTLRIMTALGSPEADSISSREEEAKYTLSSEQKNLALKRLKLATLFQMTFPGVPCIFYGDEAGLEGCRDPFCRHTFPWENINQELLSWYKKIIGIRHKLDILRTGDFKPVYQEGSVYGFVRTIKDGKDIFGQLKDNGFALVLFNSSTTESHTAYIDLYEWYIEKLCDLFTNDIEIFTPNGHLAVDLMPLEGKLFIG
jgi:4-alpha-glucanotransferase